MKIFILSALLFFSPLAISADNEKPIVKKLFRAQAINRSAGLSVLILGPESVAPGTLVKLDASQTTGDTFTWKLAGGNTELYEVSDDGKKVYFASPTPGKYSFLLAVAKGNGDKAPSLIMAEHSILIQGATPNPKPNDPQPPAPQPTDPLDNGSYGLARYVRDIVKEKIPAEKRGLASGFSANYTMVASGLKNKTIAGPTAANAKLKEINGNTGGKDLELWKSFVFVPLIEKLKGMEAAKTFSSNISEELAQVFSEISLGFAAAAVGN